MSIKYKVTETLDLMPDIIAGTVIINMYDNRYARVENFKSILEFGSSRVKFQGKNTRLIIEGDQLQIIQYSAIECNIKGQIISISYE